VANLLLALLSLAGLAATTMVVVFLQGTSWAEVFGFLAITNPGPDLQGVAVALSYYVFLVNLVLAVFNLIPLPPLDGFQAIMSLFLALRTALGRKSAAQGQAPITLRRRPEIQAGTGATRGSDVPPGERPHGPGAEPFTGEEDQVVASPAQIHFAIGLSYHKEGQLDEAIARYRQATAHDEAFGLAFYNLGLAYWAKGRQPLAMSAFRAVLQVERDPVLLYQAREHLRALEQAERHPSAEIQPPPPPLEVPEAGGTMVGDAPPLDPVLTRRLWLRLAAGGVGGLFLGVAAWIFVTVVTMIGVG
jgi:tetratricopeptide (TPR) repeat protein